jgi:ribosomal protein L4
MRLRTDQWDTMSQYSRGRKGTGDEKNVLRKKRGEKKMWRRKGTTDGRST